MGAGRGITHLILTRRLSNAGPVQGQNASQSSVADQTLLLFTQTDRGQATAAASSLCQYIIQCWHKMSLFHTNLCGNTHTTILFPRVLPSILTYSTCYIFSLSPCQCMPMCRSESCAPAVSSRAVHSRPESSEVEMNVHSSPALTCWQGGVWPLDSCDAPAGELHNMRDAHSENPVCDLYRHHLVFCLTVWLSGCLIWIQLHIYLSINLIS